MIEDAKMKEENETIQNWNDFIEHPCTLEELEDEVAKLRVENGQYVEIINGLARRCAQYEEFLSF